MKVIRFADTPRLTAGVVPANRGARFGPFGFSVTETFRHPRSEVAANRRALADAIDMPVERLVLQRQVHGIAVAEGRGQRPPFRWRALNHRDLPESDILITDRPGSVLLLSVADCCPVLLYAPAVGAIGAAHAGWRGTAAGAVTVAVQTLGSRYGVTAPTLHCWIGPCAGAHSYEVGPEVAEVFAEYPDCLRPAGGAAASSASDRGGPRGERYLLDLPEINRRRLVAAGVDPRRITILREDTIADRRYQSYRRDGRDSGRMAAWIGLRR